MKYFRRKILIPLYVVIEIKKPLKLISSVTFNIIKHENQFTVGKNMRNFLT